MQCRGNLLAVLQQTSVPSETIRRSIEAFQRSTPTQRHQEELAKGQESRHGSALQVRSHACTHVCGLKAGQKAAHPTCLPRLGLSRASSEAWGVWTKFWTWLGLSAARRLWVSGTFCTRNHHTSAQSLPHIDSVPYIDFRAEWSGCLLQAAQQAPVVLRVCTYAPHCM